MSGGGGSSNQERWLLTYADLITLLLAFFVLLYSISNSDLEKFRHLATSMRQAFNPGSAVMSWEQPALPGPPTGLSGGSISDDFAFISRELGAVAESLGLEGNVHVRLRSEGIGIVLSDTAIFASGRAELGEKAYPVLDTVANLLAALPNEIKVEGHTDDLSAASAGYSTNWELSAARAVVVVRYFTEWRDLNPSRFLAVSCSQYRPLVENDSPAGRRQNRRAEIVVVYPTD